jgi:hypothetical protein
MPAMSKIWFRINLDSELLKLPGAKVKERLKKAAEQGHLKLDIYLKHRASSSSCAAIRNPEIEDLKTIIGVSSVTFKGQIALPEVLDLPVLHVCWS